MLFDDEVGCLVNDRVCDRLELTGDYHANGTASELDSHAVLVEIGVIVDGVDGNLSSLHSDG